jgi:hypothetical protein
MTDRQIIIEEILNKDGPQNSSTSESTSSPNSTGYAVTVKTARQSPTRNQSYSPDTTNSATDKDKLMNRIINARIGDTE